MDPIGKSGGLLLGWNDEVQVYQIRCSSFSLEVELETLETNIRMWAIFVYASNKEKVRAEQWEELWAKKGQWGKKWILEGNFNDIRRPKKKGVELGQM